ncbi:hypothetical protein BpHYR1_000635 [Brachionus plicatilis]|uniref:Uncharacterized protein n=1 Tax=Brachionus plicatilis TaxID=10195 RepID=A0A3M7RAP9_BRAPC|nr:hypothetical protein BpHYR1_000635 [Brachionus plicatilis]
MSIDVNFFVFKVIIFLKIIIIIIRDLRLCIIRITKNFDGKKNFSKKIKVLEQQAKEVPKRVEKPLRKIPKISKLTLQPILDKTTKLGGNFYIR